MNDTTKFKWILRLVNFLYALNIFGFLILLTGMAASFFLNISDVLSNSIEVGNGWTFSVDTASGVMINLWILIVNSFISLLILRLARVFLKNILEDKVFDLENSRLLKRSSLYLLLGGLINGGSEAIISFDGIGFFDQTMLLMALLVWVFAKLFEKAIAIAEENEFTI